MKKTALALVIGGAGIVAAASAAPAFASTPAAGSPYGCAVNPKAAACQKAPKAQKQSNTVTGVKGTQSSSSKSPAAGGGQPPTLPTTGGAGSLPSGSDGFLPLAGLGLAAAGLALRRRTR